VDCTFDTTGCAPITCGDGIISAGETCDDGNNLDGDGCDALCQIENVIAEIEPNGSVAEADANGIIISDDALFSGSITDVADELDFYRVEIASAPTVVRFELFTTFGDCDATTTTLRLRDAAGTQIVTDNISGIRSCSAILFPFETAGVFYIQVEEAGTNANIPAYVLEANFQDDVGTEVEPNEDIATANIGLDGLDNVFIAGDHSVNTDSDFYAITVPAGKAIRAEIIEGNRAVETCEALGVDSRLTLFSAAGVQLVDDDDDGRGFCSLIDGTGTTPLDSAAKNNTGADAVFFLQVRASGFSQAGAAGQFIYRLALSVR
jgi:cysteine-rich repeat protein